MTAYYNEIDPYAAQWLRNLISAGHIAPGDVDERSIEDVRPDDLRGYTQCHFFAGIGVWSYALRRAGWPDDKPVWTGSCPCQPHSQAGHGKGFDDERHLWPAWFWLVQQCRPVTIFGEQVASKNGLAWLDLVSTDLEGESYTVGATDLCVAGFGGPHIRQRLWFVAHERMAHAHGGQFSVQVREPQARDGHGSTGANRPARRAETNGFWRDADWLLCRDGKWRPVRSGTFPLAYGVANRVGRLRAYGNSISPEVAAQFIGAYIETL